MKPDDQKLRFFLGANTPQGFVSRFDQMINEPDGWRTFIIKGGPGSGKSTLLKKIAHAFEGECPDLELIHCSSDADSLDGVIVPEKRFAVADGTPPHVLEPRYPGAVESLVDLSVCWNAAKLQNHRERIVSLTDNISRCHEYCCRFLAAAGSLTGDTYRIALDCVDTDKLGGYLSRLTERELRPQKKGQGRERVRFLGAVTNKGLVKYTDSAKLLAHRIYLINDEQGAVSRLILHHMRAGALSAGYDVVSCYCPLSPFEKLEHLFIPQLSVGILTSNRYHDFEPEVDAFRIVNYQRFTDSQKLKESKKRIAFNRKAGGQMVGQAEALLKEAKALHDELECYYTDATDFSKSDALAEELIDMLHDLN